jgi:hypothetical protein
VIGVILISNNSTSTSSVVSITHLGIVVRAHRVHPKRHDFVMRILQENSERSRHQNKDHDHSIMRHFILLT